MMALGGFALAAIYSVVVFVGGLIAFFNHTPLLLGTWSLLIPLVAGLLCWGARTRIRSSEGTLGGAGLAAWGLGLSILFGLSYLAYSGATYFAIRQQAASFAENWLGLIREGELDRAFAKTLKQTQQPEQDANLRFILETRHNDPSSQTGKGSFTRFKQREFVRLLPQLGPDTKISLQGVREWKYEKGGYLVQLIYRISSSLAGFDLKLSVHGSEDRAGSYQGRRWSVLLEESSMENPSQELVEDRGALRLQARSAVEFLAGWTDKVNQRRWIQAYEETLPPKERGQAEALRLATGAGTTPQFLAGFRAFQAGGLLRDDPKKFWTRSDKRASILKELQAFFSSAPGGLAHLSLDPSSMPVWSHEGNKSRFGFDLQFRLVPDYLVDALVFVERDEAGSNPSAWRVTDIELIRGDAPPAINPAEMPRPPVSPAGPGMGGPPMGPPGRGRRVR
jgi:hypothetical protein